MCGKTFEEIHHELNMSKVCTNHDKKLYRAQKDWFLLFLID